jgi:hypothetical protein
MLSGDATVTELNKDKGPLLASITKELQSQMADYQHKNQELMSQMHKLFQQFR